jgi:Tfp pilus assembly protein PilF
MTLNITVVTQRCIYQSADYRLTDWTTGRFSDFETQKIILVSGFSWNATVCFTGVGRTHSLDVGEWLAERGAAIQWNGPFDRLIDELLTAERWLSTVPPLHDSRHSFSVGAFVGSEPVFVLISNFQQPFGPDAPTASAHLSVYRFRPTKPTTYVSGSGRPVVTRPVRRQLERLAARDPEPQRMYSALAEVNRMAADRKEVKNTVSHACFTTHVRLTGESGGYGHDIGNRPFMPTFAFPAGLRETITLLLDQQFGPGRARFDAISTGRADESDEYHKTQLREKPKDPSAHSNYGVFLQEKKGDLEGAEREYRKAIELDGHHVNALGNLANVLWKKGDKDQAANLYRRALEANPGNENVTWNYAMFLLSEFDDQQAAREVLDRGITTHPESGRLLSLRAELSLRDGSALEALEGFQRAREKRADQARVEAGYAFALQLSGAPIGECIAAYRVAITLTPESSRSKSALRLNLAQLLFIKGDDTEASRQLKEAMRLGLDEPAQLEAQFYLLAHTSSHPAEIFRSTKSLLAQGARLHWNVRPNIETVSRRDPQKAVLLEIVSKIMAGEQDQVFLAQVLAQWQQMFAR